jgi:hypothetical protein
MLRSLSRVATRGGAQALGAAPFRPAGCPVASASYSVLDGAKEVAAAAAAKLSQAIRGAHRRRPPACQLAARCRRPELLLHSAPHTGLAKHHRPAGNPTGDASSPAAAGGFPAGGRGSMSDSSERQAQAQAHEVEPVQREELPESDHSEKLFAGGEVSAAPACLSLQRHSWTRLGGPLPCQTLSSLPPCCRNSWQAPLAPAHLPDFTPVQARRFQV